jgi:hypothetical protein
MPTVSSVSLFNMLIDKIVDELTRELYTDVPSSDPSRVILIRAGRLQEDPTKARMNLMVHYGGDLDKDALNDANDPVEAPTYEIGGGQYMRRRFRIEFEFFFPGERDRDNARTWAMVAYSRCQRALKDMPMPVHPTTGNPVDDFGEMALQLVFKPSFMRESGGPGSFIHKGELHFEFLSFLA